MAAKMAGSWARASPIDNDRTALLDAPPAQGVAPTAGYNVGGNAMTTYEQRLNQNLRWALQEGSRHFERESAVHYTHQKMVKRLEELRISYAVVGDLALFFHGYRRFTENVDLLVTRQGLQRIHEHLDGRGYLPDSTGSKHLRDAQYGVRIMFLVTGDYPGDGKPKPIAFPDPEAACVVRDGIRCLQLSSIVELKLASGMTNPGRLKDLADVQELIQVLNLPENFAGHLNPYVREKFRELWTLIKNIPQPPE
jgi:hypothetical protein